MPFSAYEASGEGAMPPLATDSATGRVRKKARVKAAAEAQAYFVQVSARRKPTMSLMPRMASIEQLFWAARNTPPDSISTARTWRAVVIQGNNALGSLISRSLEAIGPSL